MVRIGAFVLTVLILCLLLGCSEKTTESVQTGLELSFMNCFSFNAWVWIDGDYKGAFTSERPSVIEVAEGSHTLYAKSNIVVADSFFCWTQDFSVSGGEVTDLQLDCAGHGCR